MVFTVVALPLATGGGEEPRLCEVEDGSNLIVRVYFTFMPVCLFVIVVNLV